MLSVLCTAFTDTDKLEHTRGRGEGPRWVRDKSPGPETRIQECFECSLVLIGFSIGVDNTHVVDS